MGCILEVSARVMQKNHCHTHKGPIWGWETGLEHKSSKKLSLPQTSFLVFLSAPVFNPTLMASFECTTPLSFRWRGTLVWVGGEVGADSPPASEDLSPGCHGPEGQEDFITQRSMSVQDMSLTMLYLWKSIFLLTNLYLTGFLPKQQPPPGQVNVTAAAVSVPRGLPASRIQLDTFVWKRFKYFSWYAIKEEERVLCEEQLRALQGSQYHRQGIRMIWDR